MGRFVVRLSHIAVPGGLLLALALAVAALLPAAASAQGILLVHVTDQAGQPLENATVQVVYAGKVMRTAGTDPKGQARMAGLAGGTYTLTVSVLGHKNKTLTDVRVDNGTVRVIDVKLEESALELEGITAQSQRVQIQHENTDFGIQIEKKAIELLPVTYQVENLVALTPGARPGHVWGGASFQADSYILDGVSANNPGMGGNAIQPNINWIDKVNVRGLGAGAEYGGFQGGLIDITTKRGTNDFQGFFKTSYQNEALDGSNLVGTQIGSEVVSRHDIEAEARGPILRDKLFYYISGKYVGQDSHVLNHLKLVEGKYSPMKEPQKNEKVFGKLTWTPGPGSTVAASAAYLGVQADNYGITGYEAPGAGQRYTSPTWLVSGSWTQTLGSWAVWETRVNRYQQDERHTPYQGTDVPGISTFALWPPYSAYGNNPYFLRSAPSSTSAHSQLSLRLHTGSWEHTLKVGLDYTQGRFINQRRRSGGMTWEPTKTATYDPADPDTWHFASVNWIATEWGGEVNLDADVSNAAAYAQSSIQLGPRVVLSPGVRWNQWKGWLNPQAGGHFLAVQDQAVDPRVGIAVNLTEDRSLVAKAHWGRYHQDLITQMFDRAAGSDVFTNQEVWYYHGIPTSPQQTFTMAQRDSLAALGLFTRESVEALNETGPAENYHQPYINEWLVGLEKQFGNSVKLSLLYTRRTNENMVALVDRNAASNYTMFRSVRVFSSSNQPVPFSGGSVWIDTLYVPNNTLRARMVCVASTDCVPPGWVSAIPSGLSFADTLGMTWNPDYVLTNAPGARREFGQFQFTVDVARPTWGGSFSFVMTSLKGNLDNVSGYVDPQTYEAGPYVHVNEGVDAYGYLPNYAGSEGKLSIWGNLPWNMRGGAFWTYRNGDHYSPQFRLSSLGIWYYKVESGALHASGSPLGYGILSPLEGEYVFVGPRGAPQLEARANLDLHLERLFSLRGENLSVALDVFNVAGSSAITQVNTMVNNGQDYYPDLVKPWTGITSDQYYLAVLNRVQPRILRFSLTAYF